MKTATEKYMGPDVLRIAQQEGLDVYALLSDDNGMIVCGTKASIEHIQRLSEHREELLELLDELVDDYASDVDAWHLDSCGMGSMADAMRALARVGRLTIIRDEGQLVIAKRMMD